ncbi:uncharacterized protein [Nicotiana sylvestris]|uniref:uncharacterized protein n=1 Tax=Nicotiana sylvestris TaxID=4096 RepID=UPI00388C5C9D
MKEYEDIFALSCEDMTGLSTSIVDHKLPTNYMFPPVKQKDRNFKRDMSLKIKEEVTKKIKANVLRKLRHYFYAYTMYLISRIDPLKYIFQKPMPTGKLAKRKILLREDITKAYNGWRIFVDGAANFKGVGIVAVLVSETGQRYLVSAKLRFPCTNNMAEYEACILGLNMAIDMNIQELLVIGDSNFLVHQVQGEWSTKNSKILSYLHHVQELIKRFTKIVFRHVPRIQNAIADALATLSSMIQHSDKNFIDLILVRIHNHPAY